MRATYRRDATTARLTSTGTLRGVRGSFDPDDPDGPARASFVISSESLDRQNDRVRQAGIDVQSFLANPVCLFGHDAGAWPIGSWSDFRREGGKTIAVVTFADTEEGRKAFSLVRAGHLRGASIGFTATSRPVANEYGGNDYSEISLLEISLVPLPAHQEALALRSARAGVGKAMSPAVLAFIDRRLDALRPKVARLAYLKSVEPAIWRAVAVFVVAPAVAKCLRQMREAKSWHATREAAAMRRKHARCRVCYNAAGVRVRKARACSVCSREGL